MSCRYPEVAQAGDRDDGILYTVTEDATLRIFMPVLDSPQRVQLHATVDLFTAVPFSVASQVRTSNIYWLDREVMSNVFKAALKLASDPSQEAQRRRMQRSPRTRPGTRPLMIGTSQGTP